MLPRRVLLPIVFLAVVGCGRDREAGEKLALRAGLRLGEGEVAEAVRLANQAVEAAPGSAAVQEMAGRVALADRRPRDAVEGFRRAVHLEDSPARRALLAGAYLAAGRVDDASDTLDDALAQESYDAGILRQAAYVFSMAGRVQEALQHADNVKNLDPGNPATMVRVASAYLRGGRKDEAGALLRSLDPAILEDTEDLVILGTVLYELGDATRAAASFQRAAEKLPGTPDILYNLGTARILAEDFRGAKEAFEGVLEILPGDAKARGQRAYCLYRMGRKESARRALDEALKADPRDPVLQMLALEIRAGGG